MIHYITPFDKDKNIGAAYNRQIKHLPDDAMICITDGDAIFLQPDWGSFISDIAEENPDYDLIGATTNRLGILNQCHEGKFNDEMNLRKHLPIAETLRKKHNTKVEPARIVAGFFMLFSKSIWQKVNGFSQQGYTADAKFSKSILRTGGKIGIAKGLYLFHCYRPWESGHKQAWKSINHLK